VFVGHHDIYYAKKYVTYANVNMFVLKSKIDGYLVLMCLRSVCYGTFAI